MNRAKTAWSSGWKDSTSCGHWKWQTKKCFETKLSIFNFEGVCLQVYICLIIYMYFLLLIYVCIYVNIYFFNLFLYLYIHIHKHTPCTRSTQYKRWSFNTWPWIFVPGLKDHMCSHSSFFLCLPSLKLTVRPWKEAWNAQKEAFLTLPSTRFQELKSS